jgi:serine/threonine-protein kinase RsbT
MIEDARRRDLDEIDRVLAPFLSPATRGAIVRCVGRQGVGSGSLDRSGLLREVRRAVGMFARSEELARRCTEALDGLGQPEERSAVVPLRHDRDVAVAHAGVRRLCGTLGLSVFATTRVATAAMELARNAIQYAGGGELRVALVDEPRSGVEIVVRDSGPGIPNLEEILSGRYRSPSGMGAGLRGAKMMSDEFQVDTLPSGTTVRFRKYGAKESW